DRLAARERRVVEREQRAAVLVPIVDDGTGIRLLLTRRADDLPTHQGHVAFPGGYFAGPQEDPIAAALREASEEIALGGGDVELLGLLDDFLTHTGAVAVTPVVGRIVHLPRLVAAPAEVARIFTIPLEELIRPERWTQRELEDTSGTKRAVYYFEHDGELLWGLSARIVLHLLELIGFSLAP